MMCQKHPSRELGPRHDPAASITGQQAGHPVPPSATLDAKRARQMTFKPDYEGQATDQNAIECMDQIEAFQGHGLNLNSVTPPSIVGDK
jgi:hypothetical protein